MVLFKWPPRDMSERRLESMHCLKMRLVGDENLMLIFQWFGGFDVYDGLNKLINLDNLVVLDDFEVLDGFKMFDDLEVLNGCKILNDNLEVYNQLFLDELVDLLGIEFLEL